MQKTLAEIVDKFNNGIGKEMGITVESFAQGEMPDLENAVTAAIKAGNTPNVSLTEAAAELSLTVGIADALLLQQGGEALDALVPAGGGFAGDGGNLAANVLKFRPGGGHPPV